MRSPDSERPIFHRIARLAEGEAGALSAADLLSLGVNRHQIQRWRKNGYLQELHDGVYAPGHAVLSRRGRWLAACKAVDGILSHWDAAENWRFGRSTGDTHVLTTRKLGPRDGIAQHVTTRLDRADHVVHRGVPTTTPPRTLIDLAGIATRKELCEAVERMPRLDLDALDRALRRTPGRHGVAPLHEMTRLRGPHLRSHLERLFLRTCCTGLPKPRTNLRVEGKLVDFLWPDHRLVVETDGWASHRTRAQFAEDRRRDIVLTRAGLVVVRFTYDRVAVHPEGVSDDLRALLTRACA